jgi:hypothetical protein
MLKTVTVAQLLAGAHPTDLERPSGKVREFAERWQNLKFAEGWS